METFAAAVVGAFLFLFHKVLLPLFVFLGLCRLLACGSICANLCGMRVLLGLVSVSQGSFGDLQGSFWDLHGSFWDLQGSFGTHT